MQGKVVLVTGATSGIGFETARAIAAQGATVIINSRAQERAQKAADFIQRETGNPAVETLAADLSSLADMHHAIDAVQTRHGRLDVLVNNVGMLFNNRETTPDGIEKTLALGYLSQFVLSLGLLDLLHSAARTAGEARIVNVSSVGHRFGTHFPDVQHEQFYWGWSAYCQMKAFVVLFTYALARRLQGTGITANALHPGLVATYFGKNNGPLSKAAFTLVAPLEITPRQGAQTSIHVATSPEVRGVTGRYFVRARQMPSARFTHDFALQERVWALGEALTGLNYADYAPTSAQGT